MHYWVKVVRDELANKKIGLDARHVLSFILTENNSLSNLSKAQLKKEIWLASQCVVRSTDEFCERLAGTFGL